MADCLFENFYRVLYDFHTNVICDFGTVTSSFVVQQNLLSKQIGDLNKPRRGRPKTKQLQLFPSLNEGNNSEEEGASVSCRTRRKAALKVSEVSTTYSKRIRKTTKRKSSNSPVGKPLSKSSRKEEKNLDLTPKKSKSFLTHCTVVLEKLTVHETITIEQKPSDSSAPETNLESATEEERLRNSSKIQVAETLGKSKLTPKEHLSLSNKQYNSKSKTTLQLADASSDENSPENEEKPQETRRSFRLNACEPSVNVTVSSLNQVQTNENRCSTKKNEVPAIEENEVPKLEESKGLSPLKRLFPKEESTAQTSATLESRQTLQSTKLRKEVPAEQTNKTTRGSDDNFFGFKNSLPCQVENDHEAVSENNAVLDTVQSKQNGEVISIRSPEESEPIDDLCAKATPEKRITRSKRPPLKEKKEISTRTPEPSVINETPEKRITRSKMAVPKEKKEVPKRSPGEEDTDSDTMKGTSEIRVTRSKLAKPKETNQIIERATDDESPEPKKTCPVMKPQSFTQVKVKELKEFYSPRIVSRNPLIEKENHFSRMIKTDEKKIVKLTPLQNRNGFVTPLTKSKFTSGINSVGKSRSVIEVAERRRKEEEALRKRLKEEEAIRKRVEMMKAKQEDMKRKNEEKKQKATAIRLAVNKETSERLVKMEKEKEEKERMTRELLEKKKEEEANKRKQANEAKALEAETRRQKEEAARLAKIKEMEEEKQKEEELRLKQLEETEKIKKQRQEEMRNKEALLKAREMQKKKVNCVALKDKDNYDITDVQPGNDDSDDDESANPKHEIPLWARKSEEKNKQEQIQALVPITVVAKYFSCPSKTPDLTEFFGKMTMKRVRTSSAVWLDTPPLFARS